MILKVQKTAELNGTVTIPGSKSQAVRALLLATLAQGTSTLENLPDSEDITAAIQVCEALGAKIIKMSNGSTQVESPGLPLKPTQNHLNSGNSGITTRFVLPMLGLRAQTSDEIALEFGEQMQARPMTPLLQNLRELGMQIEDGFPLKISGQLLGGNTQVQGKTSQFLSALLLSLPCAPNDSQLTVENLNERPYVEMTLRWLDEQNLKYTWTREGNKDHFKIQGGQHYQPFQKSIPGDYSSASYFLAAQALFPGKIEVLGLDPSDPQADKALVDLLQNWPEVIDCNAFPDLLPTLAVIATQKPGQTQLRNVPQARIKETDRIHSMTEGLRKMGAQIEEFPDGMLIQGKKTPQDQVLHAADLHGYGDHRTIMALALAGMLAPGESTIDTAEGLNKTFPQFVEFMQGLGGRMKLLN